MIFRSVNLDDLEAIHALALLSGIGITTLSKDKATLEKRLAWAVESFHKKCSAPESAYYLFVMEDPTTHEIIGTAAIEALTGVETPFYSFLINQHHHYCPSLDIQNQYRTLTLSLNNEHKSELCTLYLNPKYRINHNGIFLSRARFLFMANFPDRFSNTLIAEMRGVSDENGISPFWEHVGKHFFNMSFQEADRLTLSSDKQFIADLLPKEPIHIDLLPTAAQAVIGEAHRSSLPAMKILGAEGFRYLQHVDIFDAGPTLEVAKKDIRTIQNSACFKIEAIEEHVAGDDFIIANTELNFRSTISALRVNLSTQTCVIDKTKAKHLAVETGDTIRAVALIPKHITKGKS